MSSSDSQSLTYESILESFVRQLPPNGTFKCHYNECNKCFTTQSRLDEHKRRRHAVQDITPREPMISSTDVRDQSMTATDDGQQQPNAIPVANQSLPTISTTSSPDSQSLDNTCDDDSDNDIKIVDTIPAVNTGQTLPPLLNDHHLSATASLVNNPCLNSLNTNTGHTSADKPLPTTGQTVIDLDTDLEVIDTIPEPIRATTEPAPTAEHQTLSDQQLLNTSLVDHNPCLNTINANTDRKSATDNQLPTTGQTVIDLPPTHVCRIDGCGLEFTIEYTLIAHQRAVHKTTAPTVHFWYDTSGVGGNVSAGSPKPDAIHECKHCHKTYVTKRELKKHRRTVHLSDDKPYGCAHNGCGLSFATIPELKRHRLSVHSATGRQYRCDGCAKTYHSKRRYDKHRLTVHSTATATEAEHVSTSVAVTAGPTPTVQSVYTCKKCDKTFDTKPELKTHRRTVHSKTAKQTVHSSPPAVTALAPHKPHACLSHGCGQSFTTISELKRHRLAVHCAKGRQYRCEGCDKKYYTRHMLDKHRLKHSVSAQVTLRPTIDREVNSNNSDSDSDLEVIDVLPAPKRTAHSVPPITGHTSKPKIIEISDTSSDENCGHESGDNRPEVTANGVHPSSEPLVDDIPVPVRPIADHQSKRKYIDISDTSSDENSGHESGDSRPTVSAKAGKDSQSVTVSAALKVHPCLHDGCGRLFVTIPELKKHRLSVHSATGRLYRCDGCDKTYHTKRKYNKHRLTRVNCPPVITDTTDEPYVCLHDGCDQSFATIRELRHHSMTVHSTPGWQYRCDDCTNIYGDKYRLNKHRLTAHSAATGVQQAPIESRPNVPSIVADVIDATDRYVCRHDGCDHSFATKGERKTHHRSVHSGAMNAANSLSFIRS
ncbi:unnamed protein product [Medioppia subpectinata]|uniref:C2H2-type domain-containing protein n=1 Tax=Medioppia subpectinata TaxID=1979941 RepID=A0A7R9L4Z4_9ACAR|nr:unnamed protein product [Medioppia subpectinata]CAG2115443.1 unnamed protein product [Medioppia subpectinata]